ncbi:hypothetical protein FRB90_000220 [Tulasnella sp. 427]|nr:hypothetical protein FRB90_000220 [Tulasnella sp. 427]
MPKAPKVQKGEGDQSNGKSSKGGKAAKGKTSGESSKRSKGPTNVGVDSLSALQSTLQESHLAASSVKTYAGFMKRAKAWLDKLDIGANTPSILGNLTASDDGPDVSPAESTQYNPIDDPALKRGFDKPIKCTPYLIAMYLNEQITNKTLGKSTLDSGYSAFKNYFGDMEEGRYKGGWQLVPGTADQYKGSPVDSYVVQRTIQILKKKIGEREIPRDHTAHITLAMNAKERIDVIEALRHIMLRAYIVLAFNLWARSDEMAELKRIDVIHDHQVSPTQLPHTQVILHHRKGWTRQLDNQVLPGAKSTSYRFYPAPPEGIAMDVVYHLKVLYDFLSWHLYSKERPPHPHDFVFPSFHTSSGLIDPTSKLGTETIMTIFQEISYDSGAVPRSRLPDGSNAPFPFTSHCFRRGGAQYRFFEDGWSVEQAQVWGGWVGDEKPDTMMKYLINVRHQNEKDYSDLLSPIRADCETKKRADNNHLGTHPVTRAEHQNSMKQMQAALDSVVNYLGNRTASLIPSSSAAFPNPINLTGPTGTPLSYILLPVHASIPGPSITQESTLPLPLDLVSGHTAPAHLPVNSDPIRPTAPFPPPVLPSHETLPESQPPVVPNLVKTRTSMLWQCAIRDWEFADPSRMLFIPLGQWEPHMWRKENAGNASKRGHRELIYKAWVECGRDNTIFCEQFPAAKEDNWSKLINDVRAANPNRKQRTTKNGTPEERAARRSGQ